MEVTKHDVELAGKLANMRISAEETALYESQLKALFNWVQELSAVNTDGVQIAPSDLAAFVRPDQPVVNEQQAVALRATFAREEDGCAKVKKVL